MSQFIFCKKCGTRNFYDDKKCGVCNEDIEVADRRSYSDSNDSIRKFNFVLIGLFIAGIAFIMYNLFVRVNGESQPVITNTDSLNNNYTSPVIIERTVPQNNIKESSISYDIVEISLNNRRAFNVAVRLTDKIGDKELLSLAEKVKKEINAVSDIGIIFFLLPEMKLKDGAWAAVDFKPEMNIRLLGLSISAESNIRSSLDNITDYFGLWLDNSSDDEIIIRIRINKNDGYIFEYITAAEQAPDSFGKKLKRKLRNGKIIFIDTDHEGQYFQIETNGDLSVYDILGFVETYKMLKLKK